MEIDIRACAADGMRAVPPRYLGGLFAGEGLSEIYMDSCQVKQACAVVSC